MQTLSPSSLDKDGFIKIHRSTQIVDPEHPHVFAVGDVVDGFGAIKAGHTGMPEVSSCCVLADNGMPGWNQANVAVENILRMIKASNEDKAVGELQQYKAGVAMIKLTLGLVRLY